MARRVQTREAIRELERQLAQLRLDDIETSKAIDTVNERLEQAHSGMVSPYHIFREMIG